ATHNLYVHRRSLDKLLSDNLPDHQTQPASWRFEINLCALARFYARLTDDILDVVIPLHVQDECLKHPVGCLLLIVSWHLIDTDNGIDSHWSITSFPARHEQEAVSIREDPERSGICGLRIH